MKKITLIVLLFFANYSFAQKQIISSSNKNLKEKFVHPEKISDKLVASFNSKGDEVWFFEDENFQGKKLVLKTGNYTLQKIGVEWNDRISSVLIPEGYEVQIFENDNFSGYNTPLKGYWQGGTTNQRWRNEGYSQLKSIEGDSYNINYNDKISSIQIYNLR